MKDAAPTWSTCRECGGTGWYRNPSGIGLCPSCLGAGGAIYHPSVFEQIEYTNRTKQKDGGDENV